MIHRALRFALHFASCRVLHRYPSQGIHRDRFTKKNSKSVKWLPTNAKKHSGYLEIFFFFNLVFAVDGHIIIYNHRLLSTISYMACWMIAGRKFTPLALHPFLIISIILLIVLATDSYRCPPLASDNDPSAGSPTDTLLRLLVPLIP